MGRDIAATELQDRFDALVLCGGATKGGDLPIEGRQLRGVQYAMEFLHANTKSLLDSAHADGQYIDAADKHVIVIGGGDTGTDCVGTSMRHGCRSLTQFEIRARPPGERAADNPWPEWPNVYSLDYGQEEAAARFGDDPREYLIMTTRFVGDEQGAVKELHTVNCEWMAGDDGRFGPQPVAGSEKVWPADLVLLAMGFLGPEDPVLEQLEVERDEHSNAKPYTETSPPAWRGSSPPETCVVARVWWCGRSMKAAEPLASVTLSDGSHGTAVWHLLPAVPCL